MERNENGLYSLFYRGGEASCFNADGAGSHGNMNGGNNGGGGVGGVTDTENGNMGGCRCEGCGNRQLAMVYSPMQCWRRLYTPDEALMSGTLFEELYKPYEEVW